MTKFNINYIAMFFYLLYFGLLPSTQWVNALLKLANICSSLETIKKWNSSIFTCGPIKIQFFLTRWCHALVDKELEVNDAWPVNLHPNTTLMRSLQLDFKFDSFGQIQRPVKLPVNLKCYCLDSWWIRMPRNDQHKLGSANCGSNNDFSPGHPRLAVPWLQVYISKA